MNAGTVDCGGRLLNVPSDQNGVLSGLWIRHLHTSGEKCGQIRRLVDIGRAKCLI